MQKDEKQNYVFTETSHLLLIASNDSELNKRRILTSSTIPSSNIRYKAYVRMIPNVNDFEVGITSDRDEVVFDCLDMALYITKSCAQ